MSSGFWDKLSRPILALAPMANVTDAAFRRVIAKYGKPAIMFTEFVSADGLLSEGRPACRDARGAGREKLLIDLLYSEDERPIVAQLFSGNPEKMYEAATLIKKLGFDGLDVNMGCPDRAIEKSGAGAALIKNPRLAREIIRAAKEGVSDSPFPKGSGESASRGISKSSVAEDGDTSFRKGGTQTTAGSIPISIKTRLGYNKDILEEWLPELLAEKPAAITIHARMRKEMSKVPAHWDRIREAVRIRDGFGSSTLILGNGDVASIAEARQKAEETGADGIMFGRAIFGNPWLFRDGQREVSAGLRPKSVSVIERLKILVEHTLLFEKTFNNTKSFSVMKKHFKAYVTGWDGAKEMRTKLMETENAAQVEEIVADFLKTTH